MGIVRHGAPPPLPTDCPRNAPFHGETEPAIRSTTHPAHLRAIATAPQLRHSRLITVPPAGEESAAFRCFCGVEASCSSCVSHSPISAHRFSILSNASLTISREVPPGVDAAAGGQGRQATAAAVRGSRGDPLACSTATLGSPAAGCKLRAGEVLSTRGSLPSELCCASLC